MKQFITLFLASMAMFSNAMSVTIEGTLITQVKGITENVIIRSSSNPAIEQQPNTAGIYSIETSSRSQDFILISPQESDATLYSPRIIPASRVNTDTLYIIPPTNPTLSIIVDNKTNRDFSFLVDKSIVIEELATSEKDYQYQ